MTPAQPPRPSGDPIICKSVPPPPGRWWIAVVLTAAVVAGIAVFYHGQSQRPQERGPVGLGGEFSYNVSRYTHLDPKLLRFNLAVSIPTGMEKVLSIAADASGRIYVGGDREIRVLAQPGALVRRIECSGAAGCLAVAEDGTIYAGLGDHVDVFAADGHRAASWPRPGERSLLTCLAVRGPDVYAADAGERVIWHYRDGALLGRIGDADPERKTPGFVIPSPYFDCAIGPDGLLRAANTGRHVIETYAADGRLVGSWGQPGFGVDGFSGCCNPAHIAMLPDGTYVTSEKGLPRVVLYDAEGRFLGAVAGSETLGESTTARDLAVDASGRVLVLDGSTRRVLVYAPKTGEAERGKS